MLVVSKNSPTDVLVVSKTMCAPTQGTRFRASARAGPLLDTSTRTETRGSRKDPELLPQNRSRQGAEIGGNPDGSGRGKIPGFGGRQNLFTFQLKSYSKFDDFGSEQAHLEGLRGVQDGTSGGPPGETSKTINDTIQEHSFITSLFCLVVFGSLSSRSSSS